MLVKCSMTLRALSSLCFSLGVLSLVFSPEALSKEKEKKEERAAGGGSGDVKSLLDQGLYSYEEGDFDAAVAAFEKAFALNPSSDSLLDFVETASAAKIFSMIRSKDSRLAGIGKQILKSSSPVLNARVNNPEQILKAVNEVLESEGQDQLVLEIRHAVTYGRNLVPALIPVLGDNDLGRRTVAINWIASH